MNFRAEQVSKNRVENPRDPVLRSDIWSEVQSSRVFTCKALVVLSHRVPTQAVQQMLYPLRPYILVKWCRTGSVAIGCI